MQQISVPKFFFFLNKLDADISLVTLTLAEPLLDFQIVKKVI